jgi:predicted GIY-YIG superfamily endonuclease
VRQKKDPHWIYFLVDKSEVVYVGLTKNLDQRMPCHRGKIHTHTRRIKVDTKWLGLYYERRWIRKFKPRYNHIHTPTIKTTVAVSMVVSRLERGIINKMAADKGLTTSNFLRRCFNLELIPTKKAINPK